MNPNAWAVPLADPCVPGPAHPILGPDRIARNVRQPHPITHPDGHFMAYEYDQAGRFVRLREDNGDILATFAFDYFGRRSNLVSGGTSSVYAYDAMGRPSSLSHNLAGRMTIYAPTLEAMADALATNVNEFGAATIAHEADSVHMGTIETISERRAAEISGYTTEDAVNRAFGNKIGPSYDTF